MRTWKVRAALVVAFGLTATAAQAQSYSGSLLAKAAVLRAITVTGDRDIDFGTVFQGVDKTLAVADATSGHFTIDGHPNQNVNIRFTLPATLTAQSAPATTMVIDTWTGYWNRASDSPSLGGNAFTPSAANTAAQFGNVAGTGKLWVYIGATVHPTAAQLADDYQGTVTLTASYF